MVDPGEAKDNEERSTLREVTDHDDDDEGGTGEEVLARLNGWDGSSTSGSDLTLKTASSTSASSLLLEGDLRFFPPLKAGGDSVRRTGEPFGFRVVESGVPDRDRGEREVGVRFV